MELDDKQVLLNLARESIRSAVTNETISIQKEIPEIFKQERAVFVTLNIGDRLRGCIGQMIARESLWSAVQNMAVSAALHDPRFQPVSIDELDDITIEISILSPLQKIDDYKEIELGVDGVLIRNGYNSGVYLPQVAEETGWDLDTFLGSLCGHKAGLNWTAYKNPETDIFTFQVDKFSENDYKRS